jgi:hypothetical protein
MGAAWILGLLLTLSTLSSARERPTAPPLAVSAAYRCLSPCLCDSVHVLIQIRNQAPERITGCFATSLTWSYEPADSLRRSLGIDSLEAAGGHACRWYPVSYRLGPSADSPFSCRVLTIKPGEVLVESLAVRTGALDFVKYPGALEGTVTVWDRSTGPTWADAITMGSCHLTIRVPR